jgi:hypothetical protein
VVGYLDVDERRTLRRKARAATLEALTELGGHATRAALAERVSEIGGFSARELEAPLPDTAAKRYANPVEHAVSWALSNLRRDGLVDNPERGAWRLTNGAAAPAVEPDASVELPLAPKPALALEPSPEPVAGDPPPAFDPPAAPKPKPVTENGVPHLGPEESSPWTPEPPRPARQGSVPPPGYREPRSPSRATAAPPAVTPRRGLSRLWRSLAR